MYWQCFLSEILWFEKIFHADAVYSNILGRTISLEMGVQGKIS